ncbi:arylsulfatase [Acidaminobacter sp. JC074]|uniref:sulfatase-like hydrolase/transferase n=1 Tax=Acidaminobacter sp. JC074 TaxID=2530199 RepID=UPI001F0E3036|nr:sulfatase-like hydrolase/transferase [Acidaminobacter sp. JC074]MCH4886097.1 arylsulfatase [Acidaminobacter sp. JC074]
MKKFFYKSYKKDSKKLRKGRIIVTVILIVAVIKLLITGIINRQGRDIRLETSQAYLDKISNEQIEHPKNIILILADDMGYEDISAFGSELIDTPNLDRLASEGTVLSNYYAPAPNCTPSRAGLLTGRYPVRTHAVIPFVDSKDPMFKAAHAMMKVTNTLSYGMEEISPDEILINEALNAYNYKTALIGKWHLGFKEGMRPNDHGFDYFYGALYSNDITPYEIYRNETLVVEAPADQEVLTRELTKEAVNFIKNRDEESFFLYYASPFPHDPAHASDAFKGTSEAGVYGDCVQELDWSIGEIMKTLEDEGISDDTLVIFTSDNGPWFEGATGDNRGRKSTGFNGGYKVPFIAWMPGTISSGQSLDGLASGIDVYPTIMDLLDIPLPEDRLIDGISMLGYLNGSQSEHREELFLFNGKKLMSLVTNDYKYWPIGKDLTGMTAAPAAKGDFLFDMNLDSKESYNIVMYNRDLADELRLKIDEMNKSLKLNLRGWR